MTEEKKKIGLDLLREPFPDHQISKKPHPLNKDSKKGTCSECGGYHALPAIHLDYVGHAALTDRLLDADPSWQWEPVAVDASGTPVVDRDGGMWIKLTVCGITRLGYGDAQGKTGANATKERIGDALRNAAMRFGAALDLWHKGGDLHLSDDNAQQSAPEPQARPKKPTAPPPGAGLSDDAIDDVKLAMRECSDIEALKDVFGPAYKKAAGAQKADLKAAYDTIKNQLTEAA